MAEKKVAAFQPKDGLLIKKGMGSSIWRPWHTRRFVLSDDLKLSYYDDKNSLKGTLTLTAAKVRKIPPESAEGRDFAFEVYNLAGDNKKKNSLIVKAVDAAEVESWITNLETAINLCDTSVGKEKAMDVLASKGDSDVKKLLGDTGKILVGSIIQIGREIPMVAPFVVILQNFYDVIQKVETNSKDLQDYEAQIYQKGMWVSKIADDLKDASYAQEFNNSQILALSFQKFRDEVEKGTEFVREMCNRVKGKGSFKTFVVKVYKADVDHKQLRGFAIRLDQTFTDMRECKNEFNHERTQRLILERSFTPTTAKVDFTMLNDTSDCFLKLNTVSLDSESIHSCLSKVLFLTGGDYCDIKDREVVAQLEQVNDSVCFVVETILKRFSQDTEIVLVLMKIIFNISHSPNTKKTLGVSGVCELMCKALKANISHKDLTFHGLAAVFKMAVDDYYTTEAFGNGRIGEIIKNVIWRIQNEWDPKSMRQDIVIQGIRIYVLLAQNPDILSELLDSGIGDLLVGCIRLWASNVEILSAICNFCIQACQSGRTEDDNISTRVRLVSSNALLALVEASALSRRTTEEAECTLDAVCVCFSYLLYNSYHNKSRFAEAGGCQLLCNILQRSDIGDAVIQSCCRCIFFVITNPTCKDIIVLNFMETNLLQKLSSSDVFDDLKRRLADVKFVSNSEAEKFPETVKDCSHQHELVKRLCPYKSASFSCDVCKESGYGWDYHCEACHFDAHLDCADSRPLQVCREHGHGLRLTKEPRTGSACCDVCGQDGSASFCMECNWDICNTCLKIEGMVVATSEISVNDSGACHEVFTIEANEVYTVEAKEEAKYESVTASNTSFLPLVPSVFS